MTDNTPHNKHHHKRAEHHHIQSSQGTSTEYLYGNPNSKTYGVLPPEQKSGNSLFDKLYNTIPQKEQAYITEATPYFKKSIHYAPEFFMYSGVAIIGVFMWSLIKKIKAGIKKKLSPPELIVKAPVHVEEDNKFYLVRNKYPEDVKPVYGVKLEPSRKYIKDATENDLLFKKTKARLKVLRKDTCQCCGLIYNGPEFHHLNNDHTDHRPENLAMLCRYCHLQYHVDVARGDDGKTGFLPDFSVAELSHLQQYMIWIERKRSEGKISEVQWFEHERIRKGLNRRADMAMAMFREKSFAKFCKYDQQIQRGYEPPKLSNRDVEALERFKKIRYGLKVIFPEYSPKDNSNKGRRYIESVHAFMNVDRNSFPEGKVLELVQRLNSIPMMEHDVLMLWKDKEKPKK